MILNIELFCSYWRLDATALIQYTITVHKIAAVTSARRCISLYIYIFIFRKPFTDDALKIQFFSDFNIKELRLLYYKSSYRATRTQQLDMPFPPLSSRGKVSSRNSPSIAINPSCCPTRSMCSSVRGGGRVTDSYKQRSKDYIYLSPVVWKKLEFLHVYEDV